MQYRYIDVKIRYHLGIVISIFQQTALKKKNEIREIYLKLPFPVDFKIYFFNITNPMEVQKGSKPILREIGPYCYE